MTDIQETIKKQVEADRVVLYMKGTKEMPMCGFSAAVVSILNSLGSDYEAYNVLADEDLRQGIKVFSDWPTIPQLYVDGEFIGGCDIITEMQQNGELATLLNGATA